MDSVATRDLSMSDSLLAISQLLNNSQSRKNFIKELLSDSNFHHDIIECFATMKSPKIAQTSNKKSAINWVDITKHYPIDKKACIVYGRGTRVGRPQPNSWSVAKAKPYAEWNVSQSLLSVGTVEQQRLVLLNVLLDPQARDIELLIGVNMARIQMSQHVLWCAKKLIVPACPKPWSMLRREGSY